MARRKVAQSMLEQSQTFVTKKQSRNSFNDRNDRNHQDRNHRHAAVVVDFDGHAADHKVKLIPRSTKQEEYIDLLLDESKMIVIATGPAGTGKSMLAVTAAIKAYKEGKADRIIITRPAVSVDEEQHGFLPGTLNEKMEPWTRPIFDIFKMYYKPIDVARMIEDEIIEISPLAFMRGRTFLKSFIIADEMQNASPNQFKMLMTRIGDGTKLIVTGDTRQTDKRIGENGLLDFQQRTNNFSGQKYIAGVEFSHKDIQRHPVVGEVLKLYGEE